MSFDRDALALAIAAHGRVARVVVAAVQGSAPREVGAAMLVWEGGQSGTIGGGTLEFEAATRAFEAPRLQRLALGPAMGQCCGGAVVLLTEVFTQTPDVEYVFARGPGARPLDVTRLARAARSGTPVTPRLLGDWFIEPVSATAQPLWVWGAGHVGRAIVAVMAPLPGFAITWVDTDAARFPEAIPSGVTRVVAAAPERLATHAPREAEHLIVTFSHALDLALCQALLSHGFSGAGLIGSATKWARFRTRLRQLGHADAQISRICCPIGQKSLGKHPQAIAIGVAASLVSASGQAATARDGTG